MSQTKAAPRTKTFGPVKLSYETYMQMVRWKESYGMQTFSELFTYIGERLEQDAVYVMPKIGGDEIAKQSRERIESMARRAARSETLAVLHEQGFIASPHQK